MIRDLNPGGDECLFQITDYWAGVLVSEEGRAIDVSIAQPHNMTERCVEVHSRVIKEFIYIPAIKDGVAVQASYYERSPLAGIARDNFQILNGAENGVFNPNFQ